MHIVPDLTDDHLGYWAAHDAAPVTFAPPSTVPGCQPAPGVVTKVDGRTVARIAWKPDEIDLAHLAKGGTIWLSTWGGLPPHMLEVQAP